MLTKRTVNALILGGVISALLGICTATVSNANSAPKDDPEKAKKDLNYASDIAPLIQNKCAGCHQAGGIAPFSLKSYQDLKKRAETIDAVVASKYMPPWKPACGYGDFANPRSLTDDEIFSIRQWIKDGAKPGDLSALPLSPENDARSQTWRAGKPDIIVRMDEPFKVPAEGPDIYRCFVFPLNNSENKFVSNVEFHPGNPKVTHHALFFLDNLGAASKKDQEEPGPGFNSFGGPGFLPTGMLGGWAPGNSQLPLPSGVARLLRKNSDLVIQMHFHPDGKEELAGGELGVYLTKTPPRTLLLPLTMRSRKIDIAPGEKAYTVKTSTTVPADFDLLQVTPHAHLLCKEIKCEATTPQGKLIPLIWIKSWDFNWQEQYAYKTPVHLPQGTIVTAEFVYDNSDDNFRNPNHPPKRVSWGEQTTDEMALIFFGGIVSNNDEMSKYMHAMIMGSLKDLPSIGVKPGTFFKAARILIKNSPQKALNEEIARKSN